jgi:hypothetical protein
VIKRSLFPEIVPAYFIVPNFLYLIAMNAFKIILIHYLHSSNCLALVRAKHMEMIAVPTRVWKKVVADGNTLI